MSGLGDFLQSIFGGSKSDAVQQSTSTPTNFTDPALQGLSPDLATALRGLLGTYGSTAAGAGSIATSATPTPQAPLSGQENSLLSTINGQVGPGTASAQYTKDVLNGNYMPGAPGGNPQLAAAITAAQRPTLDNLTHTLTTALPGRFAAAGQSLQPNSAGSTGGGSSAFDNAAALAFQSAAHTSTDIASNIGNNAWNTGVQEKIAAAGLDSSAVNNTINALTASALPRLIQQNGLDQGISLFNTQISNLLDVLKTIGAVQAPTLANTSQSTGQSQSTASKGIFPDLFPKGA